MSYGTFSTYYPYFTVYQSGHDDLMKGSDELETLQEKGSLAT